MSQVLSLIRERSFNRLQSYFPEAAQVLLAYARDMNISLVPVSKEQHSKVTSPCHVGNKLAADRRISVWLAQSTKDSATMALAASCWLCHLYTTNSGPRTAFFDTTMCDTHRLRAGMLEQPASVDKKLSSSSVRTKQLACATQGVTCLAGQLDREKRARLALLTLELVGKHPLSTCGITKRD